MSKIDITLYNQNVWGNIGIYQTVSNRNGLIRDMIYEYDADICCFQECAHDTIRKDETDIAKLLFEKYDEVTTSAGNLNYTPIFYKKDKFNVVESGYCAFPGFNDGYSKSLTWCVFEEKISGIMFGVISTHFWFQHRGEIDNLQRMENAKIMLSYIKSINLKYDIPVFATGDLNSGLCAGTEMSTWQYIKESIIDTRDIAKKSTDAMTCHSYPVKNEDGIYEASTDKCDFTLDYIFLNDMQNVEIHSFEVDESERSYISSDHCPLILKATVSKK